MNTNKLQKTNTIFMTMEGFLYFFGVTFIGQNNIVPLFITEYTGNNKWVGITITATVIMGILSQIIIGPYIQTTKDVAKLLRTCMMFLRPPILLMTPIVIFMPSKLAVIFFVLLYILVIGTSSLIGLIWIDIFGRTIPAEKRGKIHGTQQFLAGIASIAAGFIIKYVLDSTLVSNIKFAILFFLGGFILLLSALSIIPVTDIPEKRQIATKKRTGFDISMIKKSLFYNEFRKMEYVRVLSMLGDSALPFLIPYSAKLILEQPTMITTVVFFQIFGGMIGGLTWGRLSSKIGNKYVIMMAEIFLITSCGLLFLSKQLENPIIVLCFAAILCGAKTGSWLGYANYIVDIANESNRVELFMTNSIMLFPFAFSTMISGYLADRFNIEIVFVIALVFSIMALMLSVRLLSNKQLKLKNMI